MADSLLGVQSPYPQPEQTHSASPGPIQMFCNDGSGLNGTGDWRFPPAGARDTRGPLRKTILEMAVSLAVPHRLVAHSAKPSSSSIFSDGEIIRIRALISGFCKASGRPHDTNLAPGQPVALHLLESLHDVSRFPDPCLVPALLSGVDTGVLQPLTPSGRWPSSKSAPAL